MDAKHRLVWVLGILAWGCGGLFIFLSIRALVIVGITDAWNAIDRTFFFALAAYLVWTGVRSVDWARGETKTVPRKIKWGRVLLGAWFVYSSAKNKFHPAPNLFKAENVGEATGMFLATLCFIVLGFWLVVSGTRPRSGKIKGAGESSEIA